VLNLQADIPSRGYRRPGAAAAVCPVGGDWEQDLLEFAWWDSVSSTNMNRIT